MEILDKVTKEGMPTSTWSLYDIFDSSNFSSLHVSSCFFKIDIKGLAIPGYSPLHHRREVTVPSVKSREKWIHLSMAPTLLENVQLNFSTLTQFLVPCLGNGTACYGLASPTLVAPKSMHMMDRFNYELDTA